MEVLLSLHLNEFERSYGKLMFSQVSISHSVHGGEGDRYIICIMGLVIW